MLRDTKPDLVHFHNTFPLISPSAYYACGKAGVPVVQTLHNYRLLCPAAIFFRNGQVCEDCLDKILPWPGVLHACYRASHAETAITAMMLATHRWLKTWQRKVDVYVALTEFARQKFIQGGLPAEKIVVKPNFVHSDPGKREQAGEYAIFVGRLAPEKGVHTLLKAWQRLKDVPLKVFGDGPLLSDLQDFIRRENLECLELVGQIMHEDVLAPMKGARFLVFPSGCYENFPAAVVEAFACGVPVVASRLGAMAEIVEDGRTGLLFDTAAPEDLAAKVRWAVEHRDEMNGMGQNARRAYEKKYTAEKNYRMLLDIYVRAIREANLRKKVGHGVSA
jgi:glycosyltransferase involved in cell wall biosynthesis